MTFHSETFGRWNDQESFQKLGFKYITYDGLIYSHLEFEWQCSKYTEESIQIQTEIQNRDPEKVVLNLAMETLEFMCL